MTRTDVIILLCDECEEPVPVGEHCGNERPDGTSEYLCPDCFSATTEGEE